MRRVPSTVRYPRPCQPMPCHASTLRSSATGVSYQISSSLPFRSMGRSVYRCLNRRYLLWLVTDTHSAADGPSHRLLYLNVYCTRRCAVRCLRSPHRRKPPSCPLGRDISPGSTASRPLLVPACPRGSIEACQDGAVRSSRFANEPPGEPEPACVSGSETLFCSRVAVQ